MASETENLQLNLGALRSTMSLELHTHHASRIWHGRAPADGKPGIVGLNGFISVMSKLKRGCEQDDPYSDWWMLRIEDKLSTTKERLQMLREQVDQSLAGVPPALSLGENLNLQPVKLPLFISSQLGFAAVYLLAEFDELARRMLLAHHTALIDRATLERWLNEGAHALRSLFSLAQQYRYSGTQRDDFAAKNAAARNAIEKFGELPQDVLEGTRRSRFAPPISRRSRFASSLSGIDDTPSDTTTSEAESTSLHRTDQDSGEQVSSESEDTTLSPRQVPVAVRRSRSAPSSTRRQASRSSSPKASDDAPSSDGDGLAASETASSGAEGESSGGAGAAADNADEDGSP